MCSINDHSNTKCLIICFADDELKDEGNLIIFTVKIIFMARFKLCDFFLNIFESRSEMLYGTPDSKTIFFVYYVIDIALFVDFSSLETVETITRQTSSQQSSSLKCEQWHLFTYHYFLYNLIASVVIAPIVFHTKHIFFSCKKDHLLCCDIELDQLVCYIHAHSSRLCLRLVHLHSSPDLKQLHSIHQSIKSFLLFLSRLLRSKDPLL